MTQPADPEVQTGEIAGEGGGEVISDTETPQAAPGASNDPDYIAAVGTLEGVGVVSVIIAAGFLGVTYYRNRRKY